MSVREFEYDGYLAFVIDSHYPDRSRNEEWGPYDTVEEAYKAAKKSAERHGSKYIHYGVKYNIDEEQLIVKDDLT